jgi:hypothetical protein
MLRISKPWIEHKGDEYFLLADIMDGCRDKTFRIWYSVKEEYGKYLSDDRLDGFLLNSLVYAMKSGQDIELGAPVSPKLLHNIHNTLQPLFKEVMSDGKIITIYTPSYTEPLEEYKGNAVGCGCSLGVDSMASLLSHLEDGIATGYKVTHLALFNSCQFGYVDLEQTEKSFRQGIEKIRPFSEYTKLPILAIDTNLNELYIGVDVRLTMRFILSTLSCPMAVQKLIGKYIYASSYSVIDFELSHLDYSHFESAFVPLLGTESLEVILSNPTMTRVDKTKYISKSPLTPKFLDVCCADQKANGFWKDRRWLDGKEKINCGWCEKCLRTLFTLELLGKLDEYNSVFQIENYRKNRESFILNVVLNHKTDIFCKEIFNLMNDVGFELPTSVKRAVRTQRIKNLLPTKGKFKGADLKSIRHRLISFFQARTRKEPK